jgi:hypothetical protein
MDAKALEYVNGKLDERRKALIEAIGDGTAKDFSEYQQLCGQVRGLLTAQFEINDLLRKMKDNDE